jgi:hypothetical protein
MKMNTNVYVKFQEFLDENNLILTSARIIFDENSKTTIEGGYLVEKQNENSTIDDI